MLNAIFYVLTQGCTWSQVVLRPQEHKGFVLLPKRRVVERTFGWLSWCRRLNRDRQGLPDCLGSIIGKALEQF